MATNFRILLFPQGLPGHACGKIRHTHQKNSVMHSLMHVYKIKRATPFSEEMTMGESIFASVGGQEEMTPA